MLHPPFIRRPKPPHVRRGPCLLRVPPVVRDPQGGAGAVGGGAAEGVFKALLRRGEVLPADSAGEGASLKRTMGEVAADDLPPSESSPLLLTLWKSCVLEGDTGSGAPKVG
eukprot:CAMPEP_0114130498 /NCGR_PEP_ID=MMETSP0043_2-20121206/12055_1 /TAXON_ID=464988 /ORGANISM="Hemiselmis andersenii, Strain CCMP644" /LENGTH=110 /DNA_ID=CAMNT_0001223873 /DNA_START=44 /DNA_END=377 /DNA_ORIENTATION=+